MGLFLRPQPNDVMGDDWANRISGVWKRMESVDPELTSKPCAYSLWQWMMCRWAKMEHRIVASPQALAASGLTYDSDIISPLVALSDKVFREMYA